MKKEVPYFLKPQYYVEKIPLYLRENYEENWLNLFKPVEDIYLQLSNFNQSYYSLLSYYSSKSHKYDNSKEYLPLENNIYFLTKEQKELEWYWENLKKNAKNAEEFDTKVWYNKFYYTSLVHYLTFGDLGCKNDWKYVLNVFNLKYSIKFMIEGEKIKLLISKNETDELTKIIFKDIVKLKHLKIDEINVISEKLYDWRRNYLPYFDRIEKEDNKIVWESAMDNIYFYDEDYGNIIEEIYE